MVLGVHFPCGGVFNLLPNLKARSWEAFGDLSCWGRFLYTMVPIFLLSVLLEAATGSEVIERRGWPRASIAVEPEVSSKVQMLSNIGDKEKDALIK